MDYHGPAAVLVIKRLTKYNWHIRKDWLIAKPDLSADTPVKGGKCLYESSRVYGQCQIQ